MDQRSYEPDASSPYLEKCKIGKICTIVQGQSPNSATYSNDPDSGLPFFQGKAEFGQMYPTPNRWCNKPVKIALKNDILISVRAPVGDVNICSKKCCIGRGLMAIRPHNEANFLYVFYYLRAIHDKIRNLGSGTTFASITGKQLKNIEIMIPPLSRQRLVVAKIESIFAEIDSEMNKTKQIINTPLSTLFQKTKISVLTRLFNQINDHPNKNIGYVCNVLQSGNAKVLSNFKPSIHIGLEHIVSHTNEINAYGEPENFKTSRRFFKNNILYGRLRPELNKVWLATRDGQCSSDILPLVVNLELVLPKFLLHALSTKKFVTYAISHSSGTKMPRIRWKDIETFQIPVPTIQEQLQTVSRIESIFAKIDLLICTSM